MIPSTLRNEHLFGICAGFLVALSGFALLGFVSGASALSLANQTSYVGGIEVSSGDGPMAEGQDDPINNPYAMEPNDYWESPVERWLNPIGCIAIALLGGATAARVGSRVRAWRGALAVALAAAFLVLGLVLRDPLSRLNGDQLLTETLPFILIAAVAGGIGGLLVRRFVKLDK